MSYLGKKPGRRKEAGGHFRTDVSINGRISRILDVPDNKSAYVRFCIDELTETRWIAFEESNAIIGDDFSAFKTAAVVIWVPHDRVHNTIVSTYCTFDHQCEGKGFRFKLEVNDAETSSIQVQGSPTWTPSQVYTDWSFTHGIEIVPNQNLYKIQIQFEPEGASDRVCVRNICIFLEVLDGLPALGP